ncbi:MAG: endonuclease/exonuclease/phosphatase family protein [Anaerolineales bacterium]
MTASLKRLTMAGAVLLAPLHATIVVLYSIARLAGYVEYWLIDAVSYVLPLLLMLSILHMPGAIWRRSPFLLAATALPLVVFGILYGPSYLPRWAFKDIEPSFTVMSYNVWGGNQEYDRIVSAITEMAPDVVGLQELTDLIASEIQDDLANDYPYRAIDGGQAVFSRYPIIGRKVLTIGDERAPIPVQHIVLDVNGRQIGIVNAHPHSPQLMASRLFGLRLGYPSGLTNQWRDLETRELMSAIEPMDGPLVVLGDFNLTDLQSVYRDMTEVLVDAHKEAGFGLGFTRTPLRGVGPATWRIDFVFHTPDLVALETDVGAFGGSDHRPVLAVLAFRD